MSDRYIDQVDSLLSTVVRLFALEGSAREVAVLANSEAIAKQTDYDNWNGGTYIYTLYLKAPLALYSQISNQLGEIQDNILAKLNSVGVEDDDNSYYGRALIQPQATIDPNWRDKAKAWLNGEDITNQGRVRSDNIAPKTSDGLLFRSQPEIQFYKALKSLGVSFAPLPVFVRGGKSYQRIEPDFVIVKDGVVLVVEIDGDTVHHESPVEAHSRTTMLAHEGVHIERISASDCDDEDKATRAARRMLSIIEKIKDAQ